eukprot:15000032-Alexandrium_andersonii.AAC.1
MPLWEVGLTVGVEELVLDGHAAGADVVGAALAGWATPLVVPLLEAEAHVHATVMSLGGAALAED